MLWLKPRVGYTEPTKSLHFSPVRTIRPYNGNTSHQDKELRQRQYAASGQDVGSADAPIYMYGLDGNNARRVRSNDIVGILRRDERIAGYANVNGVIDLHKKIISITIRHTDHLDEIHGGFIHGHSSDKPREYYLPDKSLHVHLSHLRFIVRPDVVAKNRGGKVATAAAVVATPPEQHREELQRFIRHHLSSRESSTLVANVKGVSGFRRGSNLPIPKYGINEPLIRGHDATPYYWEKRVQEISEENRYKNAVLERKNNGWGAPVKCVCGKWIHDCHEAICVYNRAKIKGAEQCLSTKKKFVMPYDRARRNTGTTKESRKEARREALSRKKVAAAAARRVGEEAEQAVRDGPSQHQHHHPETISSLDSDLLSRISRLALDAGTPKRTMPNVDKEAYKQEERAFARMNLLGRKQAEKALVDMEEEWSCGVCMATNDGVMVVCGVCGRERGKNLETKQNSTKFMERMLAGMKSNKTMDFDGREEREAAQRRRQKRIMERVTVVAEKKEQKKQVVEEKEANKLQVSSDSEDDSDPADDDKRGVAGAMQRTTRKMANMYVWNNIQQKTGMSKRIEWLFGTDYTEAVENAEIVEIKSGKRVKFGEGSLKEIYKKKMSSMGGELDDEEGSSSDSDSSGSSSSDDEEEE